MDHLSGAPTPLLAKGLASTWFFSLSFPFISFDAAWYWISVASRSAFSFGSCSLRSRSVSISLAAWIN